MSISHSNELLCSRTLFPAFIISSCVPVLYRPCCSPGPPCLLPARNLSTRGSQWAARRPHGPGCEADRNMLPDVQTDGDWAEPGDRTLQPAGQ